MSNTEKIRALIRDVQDFPKPGVLFRDITPVLKNREAFHLVIDLLAVRYREAKLSHIAGIESRGFIFGAALAHSLGLGFVPIRKPGKLPCATHSASYALEYGEDAIHIHQDALGPGDRVVVVDDVVATGGTARAAADLVKKCGAELAELAFVLELSALGGRQRLVGLPAYSLVSY